MNELMTYNYIITLLEAAKRAAKKLKRRKKKKLMEAFYGKRVTESVSRFNPAKYINDVVKQMIKLFFLEEDYEEVKKHLLDLVSKKDEVMKPEHMYRLAPAIYIMQLLLRKCEKGQSPAKDCNDIKEKFEDFIKTYRTMREGTPFYKRWYYWFRSLSFWGKVFVVIGLIVLYYTVILRITRAASKAFEIVKKSLMGDKKTIEEASELVKKADENTKLQAFKVSFGVLPENALIE